MKFCFDFDAKIKCQYWVWFFEYFVVLDEKTFWSNRMRMSLWKFKTILKKILNFNFDIFNKNSTERKREQRSTTPFIHSSCHKSWVFFLYFHNFFSPTLVPTMLNFFPSDDFTGFDQTLFSKKFLLSRKMKLVNCLFLLDFDSIQVFDFCITHFFVSFFKVLNKKTDCNIY